MGMMTFRGKYGFLSNMYSVDFEWDGRTYHSSEAAFQSAKSLNPAERDRFTEMSGVTAKREGKKVSLRADWEDVKEDLMEEINRGAKKPHGNGWYYCGKFLVVGCAIILCACALILKIAF